MFRTLLLALGMTLLFQVFFGQRNNNSQVPPREAPALVKAFDGIAPGQGAPLGKDKARDEIDRLEKEIAKNTGDETAMWSKLRIGLIQQYVLGTLKEDTRSSGMLGFGPKVTYFPIYDEVAQGAYGKPVAAQAIYQAGDLLWRRSTRNGAAPSQSSANILESLVHKGRGSSEFLDHKIFVPKQVDPAKVPLEGVPPEGFKEVRVGDLRGTLETANPQGVLDRVNQYYAQNSTFYRIFDSVVGFLGDNRSFSYGLAILIFAVFTRVVMQPIYKRQYDSMKGMALIAPEMKKIQEKYKGKTDQESQMAQMKAMRQLQQKHGVNPLMGCGLALLQMPIFFLIVYPMIQHFEPKMELAGATFLWINSLSRPDIPLLILYGISMFFSFRLSSTPPTDEMQRQQQMIMAFAFPVIFPLFLLTYPSAFTMYWMTYNMVSTVFQWRMMKAADPSKSFVKALMGTGLAVADGSNDAVPARPAKAEAKGEKPKSEKPSLVKNNGHVENGVAGMNGALNGSPKKAAESGAVLKPAKKKK